MCRVYTVNLLDPLLPDKVVQSHNYERRMMIIGAQVGVFSLSSLDSSSFKSWCWFIVLMSHIPSLEASYDYQEKMAFIQVF